MYLTYPRSVALGETINVDVYLVELKKMSGLQGKNIKADITDPNGSIHVSDIITDENGAGSIDFIADLVGTYAVALSYAGDADNKPCSKQFSVVCREPGPTYMTIEVLNQNPRPGDTVPIKVTLLSGIEPT
ncbi:MAG: hypothetical protein WC359_13985 [Dehalococcoidia bacterium]